MHGGRVLVIDDSTTLRKLVEIALRGSDVAVDFAATGHDGVARARAHRPDVILLDYTLPDLRSTEVCARLGQDARTAAVPVIVMSAHRRDVLADFRPFQTVVDFVGKPFTAGELRTRVELALCAPHATPEPIVAGPPAPLPPAGELALRAELGSVGALELLRVLAAAGATGSARLTGPAPCWLWHRRGELLLVGAAAADAIALGDHPTLPPATRARIDLAAAAGKPALVALVEAGLVDAGRAPLAMHDAGLAILVELLDARAGTLTWHGAETLPDFVDAFGRPISLTAVSLAHTRRAVRPADLDAVYARTPRFSAKLVGAALTSEEQRVLAMIDGVTPARDLVPQARVGLDAARAILGRLVAADLVGPRPAAPPPRTLVVVDADRDGFVTPLHARLSAASPAVEVRELPLSPALSAEATRCGASAVLIADCAAADLDARLADLIATRTLQVIVVLPAPNDARARALLARGVHAVVTKPIHERELDQLLPPDP